jgi:hypothetical protein
MTGKIERVEVITSVQRRRRWASMGATIGTSLLTAGTQLARRPNTTMWPWLCLPIDAEVAGWRGKVIPPINGVIAVDTAGA